MTTQEALKSAKDLYKQADDYISAHQIDKSGDTNKSSCGPALDLLDQAVNIISDQLATEYAAGSANLPDADKLDLIGESAEIYSDMAVWSLTLGAARANAKSAIENLDEYINNFNNQGAEQLKHANFLLGKMKFIANYKGDDNSNSPTWSSGGKAYLDESEEPAASSNYLLPIGIAVAVVAAAVVAVKVHTTHAAHHALTA